MFSGKDTIFPSFLHVIRKRCLKASRAFILELLIWAALISCCLGANSELCWNNWIHLRFTEDSMLAYFYICMEIKRWNLVVVNSLSRNRLLCGFSLVFFFTVSRKVCFAI